MSLERACGAIMLRTSVFFVTWALQHAVAFNDCVRDPVQHFHTGQATDVTLKVQENSVCSVMLIHSKDPVQIVDLGFAYFPSCVTNTSSTQTISLASDITPGPAQLSVRCPRIMHCYAVRVDANPGNNSADDGTNCISSSCVADDPLDPDQGANWPIVSNERPLELVPIDTNDISIINPPATQASVDSGPASSVVDALTSVEVASGLAPSTDMDVSSIETASSPETDVPGSMPTSPSSMMNASLLSSTIMRTRTTTTSTTTTTTTTINCCRQQAMPQDTAKTESVS